MNRSFPIFKELTSDKEIIYIYVIIIKSIYDDFYTRGKKSCKKQDKDKLCFGKKENSLMVVILK